MIITKSSVFPFNNHKVKLFTFWLSEGGIPLEEERLPTLQDFLNNERLRTLYQVYFLKSLIFKNQNVKSNIKHIIPSVALSDRKSSLLIFTYIYKLYMFIQYFNARQLL